MQSVIKWLAFMSVNQYKKEASNKKKIQQKEKNSGFAYRHAYEC